MAMFRGMDIGQAMVSLFAAIVPCIHAQENAVQSLVTPQNAKMTTTQATGPLYVNPENPRYFTDGSGKAIYLAGSHTWVNFKDYGTTDPPPAFDYTAFLEFLVQHNHNFFRLWAWELPKSTSGQSKELWFRAPFPWVRPGPGMATDGKPKFDLYQFNEPYFERLRDRVIAARDRGIYVAVMLFDGYGPQFNRSENDGFPYDAANNINGISCGGTESQSLTNPAVTAIQEAYVRKVIDTVNDLDNVLYEIANEAGSYSTGWQYHIINYIKEYEAAKPAQHPVGMTFQYSGGKNETLFLSNADWISPSGADGYGYPNVNPPAADGRKVIINDTDHSFYYTGLQEAGLPGQRAWVWKNFLRGNNAAFMDPYLVKWPGRNNPDGSNVDPYWETLRINMGYTRIYAEKMNLAATKPRGELASTGYCLANPGNEYLVYIPDGDQATLDLSASSGVFCVEWMDPVQGKIIQDNDVTGGDKRIFNVPFPNDAVLYLRTAGSDSPDAFQRDAEASSEALKFGIYEISLTGDGAVNNPFDTIATVTFTPPSGQGNAKTVYAFYDGDNTWRARVYVSETGSWQWSSTSATDKGLDGKTGAFQAVNSKLRGRLLPHPKNPRHWITEDGRWFLNINDTAYFLLSLKDQNGNSISHEDFAAYVRDAVDHGITSFRSWAAVGSRGCLEGAEAWNNSIFEDESCTRLRLNHFRCSDQRLGWLLEHYPDIYIQLIIFPLGTKWSIDEQFWKNLTEVQKERVLSYIVARYAAYPQIFWLAVNDAHYGPDYPNNNALVREAGEYLRQHDPWQHPISTGHARFVDFYFADEKWATYIHLENAYDLGATQYEKYHPYTKPVFLGEDRYEQDHPELDPADMRYYQRRLYWAWLLSGGFTNYGGRWWVVHPYSETGKRPARSPWDREKKTFTSQLVGLDSVRHIRDYFTTRNIELSDFEPEHGLGTDLDGRTGIQSPKVMRRGTDEYLIYHPNAAADGKEARVDISTNARLRLDLRTAHGLFLVEWYRAEDGTTYNGGIIQGGKEIELASPWNGYDVAIHLVKVSNSE